MYNLLGAVLEDTSVGVGAGRQMEVDKCLKGNVTSGILKTRWKEVESRRMGNECLQWRRRLIQDTVDENRRRYALSTADFIKKFGAGSTVFMSNTESRRGLERTISHTSTRVSTSAKVAARKIRGGRIRGMKVLAHMGTAGWNSMDRAGREQAVQCLCECGMQNVEHIMSNCGYMEEYVDGMIAAVGAALQSDTETERRKWEQAIGMKSKVAAVIHLETRGMTLEVLDVVASSVRKVVRRIESGLRTINQVGETWPVDGLGEWAPDVSGEGPLRQGGSSGDEGVDIQTTEAG